MLPSFTIGGYGPSTGKPSEQALLDDSLAIYDWLEARLTPDKIMAYGVSLGSGIAAYLTQQRSLDGAFLITPYDSLVAVAKDSYPWLPVGLLMKHRFPSVDFLRDSQTPIAIIAADQDVVVRPARTDQLRAAIDNLVFDKTSRVQVMSICMICKLMMRPLMTRLPPLTRPAMVDEFLIRRAGD